MSLLDQNDETVKIQTSPYNTNSNLSDDDGFSSDKSITVEKKKKNSKKMSDKENEKRMNELKLEEAEREVIKLQGANAKLEQINNDYEDKLKKANELIENTKNELKKYNNMFKEPNDRFSNDIKKLKSGSLSVYQLLDMYEGEIGLIKKNGKDQEKLLNDEIKKLIKENKKLTNETNDLNNVIKMQRTQIETLNSHTFNDLTKRKANELTNDNTKKRKATPNDHHSNSKRAN